GGGSALAILDRVLGDVDRLPLGRHQVDGLVVLAAEDAGDDLAVAGGQDDRLEALGDLLVGIDDRLENVRAVVLAADAGEVRPDLAAGDLAVPGAGLVAAEAFGLGLVGEHGAAAAGVAAGEGLAIGGQRVALGLGVLVLAQFLADIGLGPEAGGLDQVEPDLGGELSGDELVEQAEERL